ncbi:MAG: hypothetical protein M3Q31_22200 [Actinomycetota bacterium]|nr:hypothetical protein [Actinomycetota bacterium]
MRDKILLITNTTARHLISAATVTLALAFPVLASAGVENPSGAAQVKASGTALLAWVNAFDACPGHGRRCNVVAANAVFKQVRLIHEGLGIYARANHCVELLRRFNEPGAYARLMRAVKMWIADPRLLIGQHADKSVTPYKSAFRRFEEACYARIVGS